MKKFRTKQCQSRANVTHYAELSEEMTSVLLPKNPYSPEGREPTYMRASKGPHVFEACGNEG